MKRMVLILALALTGCWRMTVRNGNPVGQTPLDYDNKWHSNAVFGLVEISGPYDLSKVCPHAWSVIHTETPFVQGLVNGLTLGLYNPQSVTVSCAAR